jgi:hypothetical protein
MRFVCCGFRTNSPWQLSLCSPRVSSPCFASNDADQQCALNKGKGHFQSVLKAAPQLSMVALCRKQHIRSDMSHPRTADLDTAATELLPVCHDYACMHEKMRKFGAHTTLSQHHYLHLHHGFQHNIIGFAKSLLFTSIQGYFVSRGQGVLCQTPDKQQHHSDSNDSTHKLRGCTNLSRMCSLASYSSTAH